ncbi:alpha/beta hydrolase [Occultella aeris]|uniref:Aminoacrylate hydrolase RutD n=1 Tax=Occultella aeris TaxID=2761496 RepID=A0A7M4DQE3_9MICO|nr:alpha/beta fold hydrolase [Occultella aeris]VZO39687.1 Putative aminoacrylate hydrolase RutD [Occultella aeris]
MSGSGLPEWRPVRALDRMSPRLAAAVTYPFFTRVGARRRVREYERSTHDEARRSVLDVGRRKVVTYEWGQGARTVLLVHGWRGRAAQFAALVRDLRYEGFRVVSFDAPGCGDSPGRRTNIGDYHAIVTALAERESTPFHAVVGHSVGSLAALTATAESVVTRHLVAIAAITRFRYLNEVFARNLGLGERARALHEGWYANRLRHAAPDVYTRFDATVLALPPDLRLTYIHDRADGWADIGEVRQLAARRGGQVQLIETEGFGHSRILSADVTLDTVLAVVANESLSELRG